MNTTILIKTAIFIFKRQRIFWRYPQVLETITHPYSPEFVQLFLPMVENEEIMGSMRSEGDNDPVSEFIGKNTSSFQNIIRNFQQNFNFLLQFIARHIT